MEGKFMELKVFINLIESVIKRFIKYCLFVCFFDWKYFYVLNGCRKWIRGRCFIRKWFIYYIRNWI